MVEPHVYKIGTQVQCQGRPMFIKSIQRGAGANSTKPDGIYYGMANQADSKAVFTVHASQVWDLPQEEAPRIALIKP